jgi:cytochrome c2
MVQLWKSDVGKWGTQFSKFGWIVDPGSDLPVGLERGSTDGSKVHETCATCHVTVLDDGRVWSGMPAQHLAWAQFRLALNDAWVAAGNAPLFDEKSAEHTRGILQPGSSNAESSDDTHVVPADFPLYVDLGLRKNLGYTGAGRDVRSQCFLSFLTFGADDQHLPFPGDDRTGPLVAYLSWTRTPTSLSIDTAAATRGKNVFQTQGCGGCHHVDDLGSDTVAEWFDGPELAPGASPTHPEGTIDTDRNFYGLSDTSSAADGGGPGPGLDNLLRFITNHRLQVVGTDGYAITDLHGIFASAPYLHNGSVPTLEDLFTPPASRPVTFVRDGYTVDTTKDGMSNKGHAFGTTLSDADKADLIAYLRSL